MICSCQIRFIEAKRGEESYNGWTGIGRGSKFENRNWKIENGPEGGGVGLDVDQQVRDGVSVEILPASPVSPESKRQTSPDVVRMTTFRWDMELEQ
jgi:hypothetical protein